VSHNMVKVLTVAGGSVLVTGVVLVLGYGWVRAMHYPFTLRQRKMWNYFAMFVCALPLANTLWIALALYVMPLKQSGAIAIAVLVAWMITIFYIVRRMSMPGGRLSQERP
jgi:hypothetical protein